MKAFPNPSFLLLSGCSRNITITITFMISLIALSAQALEVPKPVAWNKVENNHNFAPAKVAAAIARVKQLQARSSCTGQFISTSAHFLSASHCVADDFKNRGPKLGWTEGAKPNGEFFFMGRLAKDLSVFPFQYTSIGKSHLRIVGESSEARVLLTGTGFFVVPPQVRSEQDFQYAQAVKKTLLPLQEDMLLLQYPTVAPENRECISSRVEPLKEGEEVWAVGFPDSDSAEDGNGKQKYVAKGKAHLTPSALAMAADDPITYPESAWLDTDRYAMMSSEVLPGMSGGAVLDAEGNLVAILIARGSRDFGIIHKIESIRKILVERLGEAAAAEFFRCDP